MVFVVSIIVFAVLYAIKGGSGAEVFRNWNHVRSKSAILDTILDGKTLSTIGAIIVGSIGTGNVTQGVLIGLAWLVAVSPSMGEEHGAIGDHKGMLPAYLERDITVRGRKYDVKKGIQRGVFMGAAFALATGFTGFIAASLLFVPCVWAGQSLNRIILKTPGWTLAEPLIGAVVFGVPFGFYFH